MASSDETAGTASKRPLSPHLQVYKPQITSMMSIFHRITGVALTVGTVLLAYWLISLAAGPSAFDAAQGFVGSIIGRLLMFGWTFALLYHLCNGIRHLFWDAGRGLELATAELTGKLVLVGAAVLTLLCWVFGYMLMG